MLMIRSHNAIQLLVQAPHAVEAAVSRAVVGWALERGSGAVLLGVSDWNEGARRV
jgi:hypothetical protein